MDSQSLLQIGGIYQVIWKYCNYDYGRWITTIKSHPILHDITPRILEAKPLMRTHEYYYVGSSTPESSIMSQHNHQSLESNVQESKPHLYMLNQYLDIFNETPYSALRWMCRHGHLEVVQLIVKLFPHIIQCRLKQNEIFRDALKGGHLHVVKWLNREFNIIEHDVSLHYIITKSCENGHLHMIQWLVHVCPDDINHLEWEEMFFCAYYYGHLHITQWIYQTFSDIIDYLIFPNSSFQTICSRGHLHIAQWLVEMFPQLDHRDRDDYAFKTACKNGHLHVAQWLVGRFPDINHRAGNDYAFRSVCIDGHLHIAQWLVRMFPDIDPRTLDDFVFQWACRNSHFRLIQWLVCRFPDIAHRIPRGYDIWVQKK